MEGNNIEINYRKILVDRLSNIKEDLSKIKEYLNKVNSKDNISDMDAKELNSIITKIKDHVSYLSSLYEDMEKKLDISTEEFVKDLNHAYNYAYRELGKNLVTIFKVVKTLSDSSHSIRNIYKSLIDIYDDALAILKINTNVVLDFMKKYEKHLQSLDNILNKMKEDQHPNLDNIVYNMKSLAEIVDKIDTGIFLIALNLSIQNPDKKIKNVEKLIEYLETLEDISNNLKDIINTDLKNTSERLYKKLHDIKEKFNKWEGYKYIVLSLYYNLGTYINNYSNSILAGLLSNYGYAIESSLLKEELWLITNTLERLKIAQNQGSKDVEEIKKELYEHIKGLYYLQDDIKKAFGSFSYESRNKLLKDIYNGLKNPYYNSERTATLRVKLYQIKITLEKLYQAVGYSRIPEIVLDYLGKYFGNDMENMKNLLTNNYHG